MRKKKLPGKYRTPYTPPLISKSKRGWAIKGKLIRVYWIEIKSSIKSNFLYGKHKLLKAIENWTYEKKYYSIWFRIRNVRIGPKKKKKS